MEVHKLSQPEHKEYRYGEDSELSDSNLEDLRGLGLDEIWYWYLQDAYEGSGEILMRQGNLWDTGSLGHCS